MSSWRNLLEMCEPPGATAATSPVRAHFQDLESGKMEILWSLVAIGPVILIAVVGSKLLARGRVHLLALGFLCGATAGLYLFALGELAFRYSVRALLPGALFHLHTFAFAMVSLGADRLSEGGDAMLIDAMNRSRATRLLWEGSMCAVGYGLLGLVIAKLAKSTRARLR